MATTVKKLNAKGNNKEAETVIAEPAKVTEADGFVSEERQETAKAAAAATEPADA